MNRNTPSFTFKVVKHKLLRRFSKEIEKEIRRIIRKVFPLELQIFDDFGIEIKAITIFSFPQVGISPFNICRWLSLIPLNFFSILNDHLLDPLESPI